MGMPYYTLIKPQVEIGWLLHLHPTYTNYAKATKDLLDRIGMEGLKI